MFESRIKIFEAVIILNKVPRWRVMRRQEARDRFDSHIPIIPIIPIFLI